MKLVEDSKSDNKSLFVNTCKKKKIKQRICHYTFLYYRVSYTVSQVIFSKCTSKLIFLFFYLLLDNCKLTLKLSCNYEKLNESFQKPWFNFSTHKILQHFTKQNTQRLIYDMVYEYPKLAPQQQ